MLELRSLTIQGFKSFKEPQTIDFSELQSGVYWISGKNEVDEKLGGNGAGKSSIAEALCYLLFGKTSTKLKASSIGNWDSEIQCCVEASFFKNDEEVSLRRTWNPNTLQYKTTATDYLNIEDEKIPELFGITYETFLYSVFVSQFSAKFFDLKSENKLSILSDILDLKIWEAFSKEAKSLADLILSEINSHERAKAEKVGYLNHSESLDYSKLDKGWELERTSKINTLTSRIATCLTKIEAVNTNMSVIPSLLEADEVTLVEESKAFNELCHKNNSLAKEVNDNVRLLGKVESDISSKNRELFKYSNLKGKKTCPHCSQSVSSDHIENTIEALRASIVSLNKDEALYKKAASGVLYKENSVLLDKKRTDVSFYKNKVRNHKDSFNQLSNTIKSLKYDKETLEKDIERERLKTNPYKDLIAKTEKDISTLRCLIKDIDVKISESISDEKITRFWVRGFKDVRLLVIEDALKELELLIDDSLKRMGMGDWGVKLSISSQNQKGVERSGFFVDIFSKVNTDPVPLTCWSGGESQRLKLAGTFSLIDLINSRVNSSNVLDIEVYDEPTAFLSDEGISDLLKILKNRADRLNKRIFFIDHRDLVSYGLFDGVIKVSKDSQGSKVIIET